MAPARWLSSAVQYWIWGTLLTVIGGLVAAAVFLGRQLAKPATIPAAPPHPNTATTLPELSSTDALAAMKSIGIAELNLNGHTSRLLSGGSRDGRRVSSTLGIKDIDPPTPEKQGRVPQI